MLIYVNDSGSIGIDKQYRPDTNCYLYALQEFVPGLRLLGIRIPGTTYWRSRYYAKDDDQVQAWCAHYGMHPTNIPEPTDTKLPAEPHYD